MRMLSTLAIISMILMAIIPYTVYFLNKKIKKYTVQPWEDVNEEENRKPVD